MFHSMKQDLGIVRRPMNQYPHESYGFRQHKFESNHNNVAGWHRSHDDFAVDVTSYDHITSEPDDRDSHEKRAARRYYTEFGPYDLYPHTDRVLVSNPNKSKTDSDNGMLSHPSSLIVNREDHYASLGDCPTSNRYSTELENIYYNAAPFGYASSDPAKNKNHRRFEAHEEAIRTTMPSTANANRVDLIDTVRRKERETIQSIKSGSNDSKVIWVSAQIGGAAIEHATHAGGTVAMGSALVAGHVAAAAAAAPAVVVSFGATRLIQRIARESRLSRALKDRPEIKNQLSITLPNARADRDVYLENIDDALANSTKEGIVMVWNTTDRLLPRHLDKLSNIGGGSDSVAKKFDKSNAAGTSHELKYSVLAETRLLNKAKEEVRNYNGSTQPYTPLPPEDNGQPEGSEVSARSLRAPISPSGPPPPSWNSSTYDSSHRFVRPSNYGSINDPRYINRSAAAISYDIDRSAAAISYDIDRSAAAISDDIDRSIQNMRLF